MLHGLYRFYLYMVFIAMLLFAAFGVQRLLQVALETTLFRDSNALPAQAEIVQAVVFAAAAWITAALFGGLHYWLIRRDMRHNPAAGSGSARAFFLNFFEAILFPVSAGLCAGAIAGMGQQGSASWVSGELSFGLPLLGAAVLLEAERRRSQAATGAPLLLQRIHFYIVQLILLFMLAVSWLSTSGQLIDSLFYHGKVTNWVACGGFTVCNGPNALSLVVSTLFIALFWLGYNLLSRGDTASLLREVLHLAGFSFGVIFALVGLYHGLQLIVLSLAKAPIPFYSLSGPFAQYDIVSYLSFGLVVAVIYWRWLSNAMSTRAPERAPLSLVIHAIVAALEGIAFWWGISLLLLTILEQAASHTSAVGPADWANSLALVVTGIGYIPLDLLLRSRSARTAFAAPLRGFVFTMLGSGILAGAIGGATALYAASTAALGSPINGWQYTAHQGLAAFAVGAVLVGLYLWTGIHNRFFSASTTTQTATTTPAPAETVPAPGTMDKAVPAGASQTIATPATPQQARAEPSSASTATLTITSLDVEEIIDQLLAGKLSRDEAIERLQKLVSQHNINAK